MNTRSSIQLFTILALQLGLFVLPSAGQYVPNKLRWQAYNPGNVFPTDLTHTSTNGTPTAFAENVTPIPSQFIVDEQGLNGSCTPGEAGCFDRNQHLARFATDGETANSQDFGHKFQRSEAWDFAFDLKIESPNVGPRKEAGFYLQSTALGNSMFFVSSNDTLYGTGPGEILTLYPDILPQHVFGSVGGPLGDYNHNGIVDGADYVVWRDTLGQGEDLRANGNNEGTSVDFIDDADYAVWRSAFGSGESGNRYTLGDTVRMRMIYTPPVLNGNPFDIAHPGDSVATPGKVEYRISYNGGAVQSSGPLDFTNSWKGIPNDTLIMLRVQNLASPSAPNDSSKVTFSNFDLNGDAPGAGANFDAWLVGGVPEPTSLALAAVGLSFAATFRRRRG